MELDLLLLEDSADDAELVELELRRSGLAPRIARVVHRAEFEAALEGHPDVILSDYHLPGWNGLQALALARSRCPDIPFILVSGRIGEDLAVRAIQEGAGDYLLKDRLGRLGSAVRTALDKRRLGQATREAEARYALIVDNAPVGVLMVSRERGLLTANPALLRMLGYASLDALQPALATGLAALYHDPAERARLVSILASTGAVTQSEIELRRSDGTALWVSMNVRPVTEGDNSRVVYVAMIEDISERRRQQEQIARLSRVRAMLAAVGSALVHLRRPAELYAEGCRIAVEAGGFRMAWISRCDAETGVAEPVAWCGIDDTAIAGRRLSTRDGHAESAGIVGTVIRERRTVVVNDLAANPAIGLMRREALRLGCNAGIGLPLTIDGRIVAVFVLLAAAAGSFTADETRLLESMAADLSFAIEHMAKSDRLAYLAHYDELTGLPNRQLLFEQLAAELAPAGAMGSGSVLILADLDRFQAINDSYGRAAGDTLLRQVGERLRGALGGSGCVARIGSNRFAVHVPGVRRDADLAALLGERVFAPLDPAFTIAGKTLHVTVRAGVALCPPDGMDAETLLGNAEAALKRAKTEGERHVVYVPELNARAAERLALASALHRALERDEFALHYQPKLRLASGEMCGVEALLRWQHPEKGLVLPGTFIPLLEETGLIVDAGRWVLGEALAQHRRWCDRGIALPRVAVNVSAVQLRRGDFVDSLIETVERAGSAGDALELEITESLLMQDFEGSVRKLSILRGLGISVALDDFGTGFCSLNYLARLPIDSVKIDRSFITPLASDARSAAIVAGIIALAHALDLEVVAEGVETAAQAAIVARMGCDEAQGYFFSRPVPAAGIEALAPAAAVAAA